VLSLAAPSFATAVHAGDSLYITVWNHPELSKQVAVDAEGGVRIPLSGLVIVGGLDETAAAAKIASALRPYVAYPAVNVEDTMQGTWIFVTGGPVGVLHYQSGETLQAGISDALQSGAGPTQTLNEDGQNTQRAIDTGASQRDRIDLHAVSVERDGQSLGTFDSVALSTKGNSGPLLEPGDRIVFRYKPVALRVIGAVDQPGPVYLSPDQTLSEAIAQAGGLLPTASSYRILLLRDGQTPSLALGDPLFNQPAMAGDVVTVPQAPRVNVVGMVANPGVVSLKTDNTLLSALYTAGGPVKFADLRDVTIVRGTDKTAYNIIALTHGDLSQNPVIRDGDTVVVPRNHEIDFTPFFNAITGLAIGLANRVPL